MKRKSHFTAIKESIRFEGEQDLQTKVIIALFGPFAEVERDLISEQTKEELAAAKLHSCGHRLIALLIFSVAEGAIIPRDGF